MAAAARMPDPLREQAEAPLEWRLTSRAAFGLTTASKLQRAICRIADGMPLGDLAADEGVVRACGGRVPDGTYRPRELAIISAIRGGKSLIAACLAVHWTQRCDVSRLGPGEVPRVSVVSTRKDNADVVMDHIVGRLQASPVLRGLIVGEPTADMVTLRHPSGRQVEIAVVAGSRAGSSLVSRWSAGCIFDEFPRMTGEDEGVVNWDDSRRAVIHRLLPRSQVVSIGSPWAPSGPAYELVQASLGKPCRELVTIKAAGWDMNPALWTPEAVRDALAADPDAYRTDVAAEFSSPAASFFDVGAVTRAIIPEEGRQSGLVYSAAMDPGMRGNGWAFGVFCRRGLKKRMVLAREWRGTSVDPLSPREVMKQIAKVCREYGIESVATDQYQIDALQVIAGEEGLKLAEWRLTAEQKSARWMALRTKLAEGEIELVAGDPSRRGNEVRSDLLLLRKVVTVSGVRVDLPKTGDGRHCDFAPVILLGLGQWMRDEGEATETYEEDGLLKLRHVDGTVRVIREVKKRDQETQRMVDAANKRWGRKDPLSWR